MTMTPEEYGALPQVVREQLGTAGALLVDDPSRLTRVGGYEGTGSESRYLTLSPPSTPTPAPRPSSGGGGGGGGGGGDSGTKATINSFTLRPPGAKAPGQRIFSAADLEAKYTDIMARGQKLIEALGDPNFLDLVSTAMGMKFGPPPGWEQLLNPQPNQFANYQPQGFNPAQYTNPYVQLLQQGNAAITRPAPTTGIQYGNLSNT